MKAKDFSNLTIADISNLVKENERLKEENEALKKSFSDNNDDYIVYVKKDKLAFINGSAAEITASIRCLINQLSRESDLPFHLILSIISMGQNLFGKEE
ncbi:MAG: hypothetical protein MRZ61_05660 [Oscillospiraceae bacterium]|nr:hypothetical protein [Oscillospiraceae bacterium]